MKLHTLLDLHGSIPVFVRVTDGKVHDVSLLDQIAPEPGAFYVMDRGYLDFERLYRLTRAAAFFVTRTKDNVLLQRRYSHRVDPATGVRSDHTVVPATPASAKHYPAARRVRFFDAERRRFLVFLTHIFDLSALTIAYLYKARWQVELVLQVDQAAPAHQGLLWPQPQRRALSGVDRHLGVCADSYRPQGTRLVR